MISRYWSEHTMIENSDPLEIWKKVEKHTREVNTICAIKAYKILSDTTTPINLL